MLSHDWDIPLDQAGKLQRTLAEKIIYCDLPKRIKRVAGFDLAYEKKKNLLIAGMVVLDYPALEICDEKIETAEITFPYISGFLSFREAPAILKLLDRYPNPPDVLVLDGHGIAHPRGLGIASHVGVLTDLPAIGCAKSRLIGEYDDPDQHRGKMSTLSYKGKEVGCVLRTRSAVKPVFVSVGHRAVLDQACRFMLSCCRGYRIPEPTRLAHNFVTRYKKNLI